jgi:hypothetical protein
MVDPAFLQQSGVDLDVPFLQHDIITEWVLWTPPHPGFAWNHHLHTEDEVYEYNIVNDWAFPNHYLKDQVVFAAREVDQSDFISELRDYWNTWVSSSRAGLRASKIQLGLTIFMVRMIVHSHKRLLTVHFFSLKLFLAYISAVARNIKIRLPH